MHTLCIIDMQPKFPAAKKAHLVKPALREIALSKKNNGVIVLVEYTPRQYGKSLKYIKDAIAGYPKAIVVEKCTNDGSEIVARTIKSATKSNRVRVLGVNTDCCVSETVIGLWWKFGFTVEVVGDACWSGWDRSERQKSHHDLAIEGLKNVNAIRAQRVYLDKLKKNTPIKIIRAS